MGVYVTRGTIQYSSSAFISCAAHLLIGFCTVIPEENDGFEMYRFENNRKILQKCTVRCNYVQLKLFEDGIPQECLSSVMFSVCS